MKFATFFDRIMEVVGIRSQRELAEALGISRSSVSSAKSRGSVPPRWILKLAQDHKINTDWLLTGMGDRHVERNVTFESVPLVRATLSAGGGSLEVGEEVLERMPFRLDWLKRKGNPDKMVMFPVTGDSMEPVIRHGDTVLVDRSRTDIVSGRVYAVGVEDAIYVKRVEKGPGGITLVSENPAFPPETFTGERADALRIIGRMIWSSREYL